MAIEAKAGKHYKCQIATTPIRPLADQYQFAAKIVEIWEYDAAGSDGKRIGGLMTEWLGETERDAKRKALKGFDEWVAEKRGRGPTIGFADIPELD
jgi:hypothetical protein